MNTIAALKAMADKTDTEFTKTAMRHYVDGRWGYYRAVECEQTVPDEVETAFQAHHAALHTYYLARDGVNGFLGARGL